MGVARPWPAHGGSRRNGLVIALLLGVGLALTPATAWPAAASPFMTLVALSIKFIVPLMAWIGSLPARMVFSTVLVIFASSPSGCPR